MVIGGGVGGASIAYHLAERGETDVVLVGILLYAILGKLADLFARGLERYWLRWHPGYQVAA